MTKNLNRFVKTQRKNYYLIKKDLIQKRKDNHWIWYVFPQLKGLGYSCCSIYYGLDSIEETKAYFKNLFLKRNMINFLNIILQWSGEEIRDFFGFIDYKKFHSSMTIFYISTNEDIFRKVLFKFYNNELDRDTLDILEKNS